MSPEHCFDEALGDLFVARGAGNYLASTIPPAVKAVSDTLTGRLANMAKENVIMTVERLRTRRPVMDYFHDQMKIRIVGGIYHLIMDRVELAA